MEVLIARRRLRRREQQNSALSRRRILRTSRDTSNPFSSSVSVFRGKYSLNQDLTMALINEIMIFLTGGSKCFGIPPEIKVLSALHFFTHGSDQKSSAREDDVSMSQPSLSRAIHEVTEALNQPGILTKHVKFPNRVERQQHILTNYVRFGLPGVLGYVDSTHVLIRKPTVQEEIYLNRKFQHSINVQIACDSDLKILNILARYPGSSQDSFIWSNSALRTKMQEMQANGEQCWLLGDSGYPSECWLLTPILNAAEGSREATYTEKHVRARNCVERCIGVMKGRFRCISNKRPLEYSPTKAAKIINACAVLHNLCAAARLPEPAHAQVNEDDEDETEQLPAATQPTFDLRQALQVRNRVVDRL